MQAQVAAMFLLMGYLGAGIEGLAVMAVFTLLLIILGEFV